MSLGAEERQRELVDSVPDHLCWRCCSCCNQEVKPAMPNPDPVHLSTEQMFAIFLKQVKSSHKEIRAQVKSSHKEIKAQVE